MPTHDWTRVPAGLFHHFHQDWTIEIARTLNRGLLPSSMSALVVQREALRESEVLTIASPNDSRWSTSESHGHVATTEGFGGLIDQEIYSRRANRIVVRHHLGRIVAVIEIVSPGNKASRAALRDFVDKIIDLRREGVHVLIVDLFPPTPRDPRGIHKVIWDEIEEEEFEFPADQDRILVSYETGAQRVAYIEPIAVGDALPDMPLFLTSPLHVQVPLETTYQSTWEALPREMRLAVETGRVPHADVE